MPSPRELSALNRFWSGGPAFAPCLSQTGVAQAQPTSTKPDHKCSNAFVSGTLPLEQSSPNVLSLIDVVIQANRRQPRINEGRSPDRVSPAHECAPRALPARWPRLLRRLRTRGPTPGPEIVIRSPAATFLARCRKISSVLPSKSGSSGLGMNDQPLRPVDLHRVVVFHRRAAQESSANNPLGRFGHGSGEIVGSHHRMQPAGPVKFEWLHERLAHNGPTDVPGERHRITAEIENRSSTELILEHPVFRIEIADYIKRCADQPQFCNGFRCAPVRRRFQNLRTQETMHIRLHQEHVVSLRCFNDPQCVRESQRQGEGFLAQNMFAGFRPP